MTASFVNIPPPGTLTLAETYTFAGTDCSFSVTALQTIEMGGSAYYAPPVILTSQLSPLTVTYQYASLTPSIVLQKGSTVIFVFTHPQCG